MLKNSWYAVRVLFVIAMVVFTLGYVARAQNFPLPKGSVSDYADRLSAAQTVHLQRQIAAVKGKVQIAVAIVPDLGATPGAQYTAGLFNKWGIGKKGEDRGLLILFSIKEKYFRIEPGYGAEAFVTDARAAETLEKMKPFLRKNDFHGAISAAVEKISEYAKNEKE